MEFLVFIFFILLISFAFNSLTSESTGQDNSNISLEIEAMKLFDENKTALAIVKLKQAVDAGSINAAITLADMATDSTLINNDDTKLLPEIWYEKAGDLDPDYHKIFLKSLATGHYPNGKVFPNAPYFLHDLLLKGAENGNRQYQLELGMFYSQWESFDPNQKQSLYWLEKAAMQDCGAACEELGLYYINIWYNDKASDNADEAIKARGYLEKAFILGELSNIELYADALIHGWGGDKRPIDAEKLLLDKYESQKIIFNDHSGCYRIEIKLAKLYIELNDLDEARHYFEKAAINNIEFAQPELAQFLLDYSDSADEHEHALSLLKQLINDCNLKAFSVLGRAYQFGRGVKIHLPTASMYYQLSGLTLEPEYIEAEQNLASQLSYFEIKEATALLKAYRDSHPISYEKQLSLDYYYAVNRLKQNNLTEDEFNEGLRVIKQRVLSGSEYAAENIAAAYRKLDRKKEEGLWLKVYRSLCSPLDYYSSPFSIRLNDLLLVLSEDEIAWVEKESSIIIEQIEEI